MSPEAAEAMDAAWERRDAELLAEHADASVYHADWRDLLEVVRARGGCDALIVDAPYSKRTHSGHDSASAYDADGPRDNMERRRLGLNPVRRRLDYSAWAPSDVAEFVDAWAPSVRGWFVSITDHNLAPAWASALEASGRYVFAPLASVEPGSRVRLAGDGPSNWACWIVVARPRSSSFARWGTLPGAYVVPPGHGDGKLRDVVGGKPLWLMESLVRDYSRPGDLVVDPCCGAGTTLVAAQRTGRRSIGGDAMRAHAELAAKRISRPAQQPLFEGR